MSHPNLSNRASSYNLFVTHFIPHLAGKNGVRKFFHRQGMKAERQAVYEHIQNELDMMEWDAVFMIVYVMSPMNIWVQMLILYIS